MGSVDTAAHTPPPCQLHRPYTYPRLNPAPAAPPAWDTHEATRGTGAMEEPGYSWPGTVSQKSEHCDLPQPRCKGCPSQKPLLQAPTKLGNTAPPPSTPSRQKWPRTEKYFTWGRRLCSMRECGSVAQGSLPVPPSQQQTARARAQTSSLGRAATAPARRAAHLPRQPPCGTPDIRQPNVGSQGCLKPVKQFLFIS